MPDLTAPPSRLQRLTNRQATLLPEIAATTESTWHAYIVAFSLQCHLVEAAEGSILLR